MEHPEIRLYNTKSRSIKLFTPINRDSVGIYSCGPTVYHYTHLGNLRACIFADVLHRLFIYANYKVTHVMNITDVGHLVSDGDSGEDKLEKGARREGKTAWDVARYYTDAFFKDITSLNIQTNEYSYPRATETIKEQVAMIKALEEKGYTYTIGDGVYFDTSKFQKYPDFARLDIQGLESGARVEENKEKRNITDFALWKFSPKNEKRDMEWGEEAGVPWGKGFPGWHIECSAMSKKLLGNHFDIHTGGIDHIPVHHTNEIAQSECANGETSVNYWLHNNFLNDTQGKMAKSNGDFLRMQSLADKNIPALALRYYLLTAHYRSEIAFSFESLSASAQAYEKLVNYVQSHAVDNGTVNSEYQAHFDTAIFDDIGTPEAIALIWKMIKDSSLSDADKVATIFLFDEVLGLDLLRSSQVKKEALEVGDEVRSLMHAREEAKNKKDFAKSDALREQIRALGYEIKDTANGQEVVKAA